MSESFRPLESAAIQDELRIRLEGTIELLEDALPLLDSLTALLQRDETGADDVQTLRECLLQLPRISEALDVARRHDQATALARAVGQRVNSAHQEANVRLENLGQPTSPSLRGAVAAVLEFVRAQGKPPTPDERLLFASEGRPWFWAACIGVAVATFGFLLAASSAGLLGFGAFVAAMLLLPSRPWVLLADRLYLAPHRAQLARAIPPAAMKELEAQWGHVAMVVEGEPLALRASSPKEVVTSLKLLQALPGLESPARPFVLLDAVDEVSREQGRALVSADGVLFVSNARKTLAIEAITPAPLPTVPSLDDVLGLIAHLPQAPMAALAEQLERRADARWFSREDLSIEEDAAARLGVTVRHDGRVVRLTFSWDQRRLEAKALLGRLKVE